MANLVLVSDSLSHAAYTRTLAMLQGLGHTVTGVNSQSAVAATLATYDLIVCVRTAPSLASSNIIRDAFNMGTPVLCGDVSGTQANTNANTGPAVACRLALSVNTVNLTQNIARAAVASPIWAAAGITTIPSDFAPYSANDYEYSLPTAQIAPGGAKIGNFSSSNFDGILVVANKGSSNLDDVPFPASIAFCGFLYGGNVDYSATGIAVIGATITALLTRRVLTGTVKDSANNPLARKVRAHRRSDGVKVSETTSNASTGAFTIDVSEDVPYTIVCLDEDGGTKNALVKDRVISILV